MSIERLLVLAFGEQKRDPEISPGPFSMEAKYLRTQTMQVVSLFSWLPLLRCVAVSQPVLLLALPWCAADRAIP